jgi:hypothetical protein
MFIAQDANFCLNNRACKGKANNPPLQLGLAFMIDPVIVNEYISSSLWTKKRYLFNYSIFLPHSSLYRSPRVLASKQSFYLHLKLSHSLVTTGVSTLGCHHKFWLLQCIVNLQKGEWYV